MGEKNHYIPKFYQKRWAVHADNCVCVYSRPHKEVRAKRKHPTAVGYEPDLYTVSNIDVAAATFLERHFFQVTDDSASKALAVLEAGPWLHSMNSGVRSGWTRFIMSLLHRNPEQIRASLHNVSQYVILLKPQYERLYQNNKDANHPPTFDEFWQLILPDIVGRTWIKLVQTTIDSESAGQHFNDLLWTVLDFKSSRTFLTGDRPIIMSNGMNDIDSHLAIPIGPRKLFFAAHNTNLADALKRDKADNVVAFINDKIVRQARRFCIGTDDTQLRFFSKRFGEMLPGSPFDTLSPPTPEELAEMVLENEEVVDKIIGGATGANPRPPNDINSTNSGDYEDLPPPSC